VKASRIVFGRSEGRASGARARNRTENLGIKSPLLCQLSYAGASADFDRLPDRGFYCLNNQRFHRRT
jgi:hypothetical protein